MISGELQYQMRKLVRTHLGHPSNPTQTWCGARCEPGRIVATGASCPRCQRKARRQADKVAVAGK
jgi:hypothetical protein